MVKVVNNSPNFIGLSPVSNIQTTPVSPINNLSEIEDYIKLIEKALELFTRFNDIKTQLQNKQQVQQPIQVTNIPVERPINNNLNNELNNNGVDNITIDADFILGILQQLETMKNGITVKEVIDLVQQNKETLNNIIKLQGVK